MLTIGSAWAKYLLSKNKKTKAYQSFIENFFGINQVQYNALHSPINACRTGAIIEERYIHQLDGSYFEQIKATHKELDVLVSSIDFAKLENGKIVDFIELKTLDFSKFIDIDRDSFTHDFVKKKFKDYFIQIQHQLLTSDLESCELHIICVYNYDDEENKTRDIHDREILKARVYRDEEIINALIDNAKRFQAIRDYMNG